ncbi:MAG TPA: ABC-F family ATP-binding cassette domain-containing protein [Arsenicitalea sp.]|nr:ABC-F family ATP-binding cassette domain-containing protein [Arsenicitalea sp.]
MASIALRNVGVIATSQLFENLSFVVGEGDRIGLVAGNGGGKTTLLRCLAGLSEPTQGEIVCSRGLRIGYVEQDVPAPLLDLSLHEAIRRALPPAERESEAWRVDVVLDEFDTPMAMRDRPLRALSGGWQRLALIARIWVTQPDALLLDEPTNHLDLAKLFQLEAWLKAATRAMPVVIASHDRDFLDACTNRTLFLRPGTSHYFALPFSRARQALAEVDAAGEAKLEKDLKEAKRLRRNANELKNIGINSGSDLLTVKAKYLRQRAEAIEDAARPVHKERSGKVQLTNSGTHAKVLLTAEAIAVETPSGQPLFRVAKLHVFQGDRIIVLGRNGSGKSQFVRLLHKAMSGGVPGIKVGPSIVVGYSEQDLSQLPVKVSPLEFIAGRFNVGDQRSKALLAGAGFAVEKQGRPIAETSFGQRARLALLALRLTEPNFYLLDEPTNHVDIAGQEALESEILVHEATCILVSHDRHFIHTIGTRFLLIDGGKLTEVSAPEDFFASMSVVAGS